MVNNNYRTSDQNSKLKKNGPFWSLLLWFESIFNHPWLADFICTHNFTSYSMSRSTTKIKNPFSLYNLCHTLILKFFSDVNKITQKNTLVHFTLVFFLFLSIRKFLNVSYIMSGPQKYNQTTFIHYIVVPSFIHLFFFYNIM